MEKSKAQQYFESLKTSDKYPTSESIVNAFNAGVASTTPQSVEMSLEECKDKYAKDSGYKNWKHLSDASNRYTLSVKSDYVAELYASQFKK